jgi:hypothetical protein
MELSRVQIAYTVSNASLTQFGFNSTLPGVTTVWRVEPKLQEIMFDTGKFYAFKEQDGIV